MCSKVKSLRQEPKRIAIRLWRRTAYYFGVIHRSLRQTASMPYQLAEKRLTRIWSEY